MAKDRAAEPKLPPGMASGERLAIRVPEAAALLGLSRSKFYDLVAAGEIPLIKVGSASIVAMRSLEAFIERRLTEPVVVKPPKPPLGPRRRGSFQRMLHP
ncbi:MAG: helix-turn-helix domain-containing protein [Novosphingobium aromaticivorans]|jgi:excisionase family DNA binding protein|uniref:DNA binding domain protein, excisionase family n=1 Tax=Novosphingobium nitrogenifigens DSM 19370 TaxID=983920 RepID=F1ZAK1_9SPHN|nr:helix-turn-helix domain-containing protein [Novosphingobium nitrogenifigens]EGD58362.1 DNA binding domain protein, excisionase family [Novosphingobium nitrogenifigens DSM 19370]MDK4807668.1 helix-turn-helix domain-containing protein [Novosphingobium aromaticivorans]